MHSFLDKNLNPVSAHSYWTYDGVQYPSTIFSRWSGEELASVGIYKVEREDVPVPEGKQVAGWEYEIKGDKAVATPLFEDFVEPVPVSISRAQGKAAMLLDGLLEQVQEYIESLEGTERAMAELAFNDTNEWRRDSPFLNHVANVLEISEERIDELFVSASKIIL